MTETFIGQILIEQEPRRGRCEPTDRPAAGEQDRETNFFCPQKYGHSPVPPPSKERHIIHLDMDCFYAAIEVRDRPALRGKPVGVGGARDRRGVLTTCNYEARAFGVRSAMPTFMALQRCPKLIVLPTRFDVYRKEAGVVLEIMHRFTPLVETLSLVEAYLAVSANPRPPGPLAREIRDLIFKETKLTAPAGIGPNKLVAKIASEINKPNGQYVVKP